MFNQALQFSFIKEPPVHFLEIFQKPLKGKQHILHKNRSISPYKFKRLRISTQHDDVPHNIVINLNIQSPNFRVMHKFDYYDNNLTIHSQIISAKTTPKSSRSNSPLKKAYLGGSLVARRKLNGYVKCRYSPDPYQLQKRRSERIQKISPQRKQDISSLVYRTASLLQKYGC